MEYRHSQGKAAMLEKRNSKYRQKIAKPSNAPIP